MRLSLGDLLWKWLEPRVQATITDRLISFHQAMNERGDLVEHTTPTVSKHPSMPRGLPDAERSSASRMPQSGLVLPFSERPLRP